jgi:hypothetical protein
MNRLAAETSPYLQQHKENPVDWYPWSDEAFDRARREDKPVLLSVGYSACHWCHVMAHESFEDEATADVMNQLFVNVKVDREERPDVDAVYMDAVQAMTGQGGWPMTVFLTPDARPFYGGTYYPRQATHGRPGFVDVLQAVAVAWSDKRDDLLGQAERLSEFIQANSEPAGDGGDAELGPDTLRTAYQQLASIHDPVHGGFGRAPKFPQASFLELLLRAGARNHATETRQMLVTTLDAMASGGIYDHLGGGFARYSVDTRWLVPHFEKMLYDQAQLIRAYVHGWQVTRDDRFRQVVEETVDYVGRDLRAREGGLFSAEDADSEGVEGKFYVWTVDEVTDALGDDELADAAMEWWGVTASGNFEGTNILNRPARGDLARPPAISEARRRLLAARNGRVRPGLDDKVLTEWNAMFVAALAEAGAAMGRDDWLKDAGATADFLLDALRDPTGRWLRSWQGGRARQRAFAVDYAWLVDAFTRLAEANGAARWIAHARDAADSLLDLFWDDERGGLFTTGNDAETLIVRQKDLHDGATPSANSVAAVALVRLGALTGVARYTEAADGILAFEQELITHHPTAVTYALAAVDLRVAGVTEIVVTGERADLVAAVHGRYLPNAVLAWGEPYASPLWDDRPPGAAYVCEGYSCKAPAPDVATLVSQLEPPKP